MIKTLSKIAAAAAMTVGAASSHAYLIFEVSQFGGGPTITNVCSGENAATIAACGGSFSVTTNGLGQQVITFTGTVGDFFVSSTNSVSNSPGTASFARVSTTALSVERISGTTGDGRQLFIGVRAFNFSQPDGELKTLTGSSGMSSPGGLGSGTITSQFWADPDNLGAKATPTLSCSYPLTAAGSCSTPELIWADPAGSGSGLFSLRSEHIFNIAVGSVFEGTTSAIARRLPEPMTLTLVGAALVGAAVASRRSKKA